MSLSNFHALGQFFDVAQVSQQKVAVILDEQAWTYGELVDQVECVARHLLRLNIAQGQTVYQFVDRSLEMVYGLLGIMCAGGVYCPLNPTDPPVRLVSLLNQIQGQYVLLHGRTQNQFPSLMVQHVVMFEEILHSKVDSDEYEELLYETCGNAYIICTSGTTGRQKAIVHTHESFSAGVATLAQWHVEFFSSRDQGLQIAACSWGLHLYEILPPLVLGGTVVLLRPGGQLDMAYFYQTLVHQQVTTLAIGPTMSLALVNYLELSQLVDIFARVRNLCLTGESMKLQRVTKLLDCVNHSNTRVFTYYGLSECGAAIGFQLLDIDNSTNTLPIGYSLPGFRCLLIDEHDERIIPFSSSNEIGEIYLSGAALFQCYYNDPELTNKTHVTIDSEQFFKTGDLARYNAQGQLVHVGRVDFQIKIHGQRVETAEIESIVMAWSSSEISNCLVVKFPQANEESLVAYVVSTNSELDTESIRDYCRHRLRQYMVPSYFVIIDKLPLNANGKVDRKQLPSPSPSSKVSTQFGNNGEGSMSELEDTVHHLWCSMLRLDAVPRNANCFALGGSSLSLMQLFNHYQFHLAPNKQLNVLDFFRTPTIADHIRYLTSVETHILSFWRPLHLAHGLASFAQERLWMDEKTRFDELTDGRVAVYNEMLVYKLTSSSTLSIHHLHQALALVVAKHQSLRTALIFDQDKLVQQVLPVSTDCYKLQTTYVTSDDHLNAILLDEETNPNLFDLGQGLVFRCHLLRHSSSDHDDDSLIQNDIVIFNFHHVAIDGNCVSVFVKDLRQALLMRELTSDHQEHITYLDYAQYERLEDWSHARQYWGDALRTMTGPIDPHKFSTRTGRGLTVSFGLDSTLVANMTRFASESNLTLFQLGLAAFYTFLFKISNDKQYDLCTGIVVFNRRYELQNMIGFFANTLPCRLRINPYESFAQLCCRVQHLWLELLPYSRLPYQEIVKLHPSLGSSLVRTLFMMESIMDSTDQHLILDGGVKLEMLERRFVTGHVAQFDLACILNENRWNQSMSFSLNASVDVYNESTITKLAHGFKYLLDQLFLVSSKCPLSLLMLEEHNMERQLNTKDYILGPASYAQEHIWLDEQDRVDPENSNVAIYNMPFLYRLSSTATLSIKQIHRALQLIVIKHSSLRTSLIFDIDENLLMQRIIELDNDNDNNKVFAFVETTFETDEELLNNIMYNEQTNPNHFDLSQGLVFRCHIVHHKQLPLDDLLYEGDALIFNFHHAIFDFHSMQVFLHDFDQAYSMGQLLDDENTTLRYIDYAITERQMPMIAASTFWLEALRNCEIDRSLSLPFDRRRLSDEYRTGRGTSVSFNFGQDLSRAFLAYTSMSNMMPEYLALASYYAFLFKLTNGERDLCVGMNTHGRYKTELQSIIGLFTNVIPLRCQIGSHSSFDQLVEYVSLMMTHSLEHSYFPIRRILAQHPLVARPAFLDTAFKFQSILPEDNHNQVTIGAAHIYAVPYSTKIMSKYDFSLTIDCHPTDSQLSFTIEASIDLFDAVTINKIGQRFLLMLKQLFEFSVNRIQHPVHELSLILPDETLLIQSINNTHISFPSATCLHHEFVRRANEQSQKMAVELDEQSLTYGELLYYVQRLAIYLLKQCNVTPGEIICQCVERSLSMVIGIMSIEMAGAVYCPFSPQDSSERLHMLVQETKSRLVLIHAVTKDKLKDNQVTLDIDTIIGSIDTFNSIDLDRLSSVRVTPESIAYIIFTSGSTGTPKAAQVRHRNFTEAINTFVYTGAFSEQHIIVQIASCSFDVHLQDIGEALIVGATLVMLRPRGNMDFEYLVGVFKKKTITFMQAVPTLLKSFFIFLKENNFVSVGESLRSLCSSGESLSGKLLKLLRNQVTNKCQIWNVYGPAETTIGCTYHLVQAISDKTNISIGQPLPNYQCLLIDEFSQPVVVGQDGELLAGGIGVFAGYLGRNDLTANALININDQDFYRTGDFVRLDSNGLLHYVGRKDHQVKLRGQRIELDEIEQCLLDSSSNVSACVVIKWDEDHLIAYIESKNDDVEEMRKHCQSRLPPFMIPSMFIVLERLPLNANGKLDRKRLPKPDFSTLPSLSTTNDSQYAEPSGEVEMHVHTLWCEVLHFTQISINTSFFSIGGHSLLLIQLYHRYKMIFDFGTHSVSIALFFQHPSIADHARLIGQAINKEECREVPWVSLHLTKGRASFAQERIILDEHIRFTSKGNVVYTIPLAYRISGNDSIISIVRLRRALRTLVSKHKILHTVLDFDRTGVLMQSLLDVAESPYDQESYGFAVTTVVDDDDENTKKIYEKIQHSLVFDLTMGCVLHCHVVRHRHSLLQNDDLLTGGDIVLFSIHHSVFDGASMSIFLQDLSFFYDSDGLMPIGDNTLQYIDYSVHERLLDMATSRDFWYSQLDGYDLKHRLTWPVDRYRSSDEERSGVASVIEFSFDDDLSRSFLVYASSHHVTPFQLGLAAFYAFLFKMNNGESDLCIAGINANRYRTELRDLIGMFVATLPYRIQLDPHGSFEQLVREVADQCLSILDHSHYPLQYILSDSHHHQSTASFLETVFNFISVPRDVDRLTLNGAHLESVLWQGGDTPALFDLMLKIFHNPSTTNNAMSCSLACSRDLFEETTVARLAQRLQHFLSYLFSSSTAITGFDRAFEPLVNLSLLLPEEVDEIQRTIFHQLPNVLNRALVNEQQMCHLKGETSTISAD